MGLVYSVLGWVSEGLHGERITIESAVLTAPFSFLLFLGLLWIVAVFTPPLSFTPFNLFNQVSHHAMPKKKWTHWMFVFDMPSELCLIHWGSVVCHYLEVLRNVPGPVQVKINPRKLYHHRKEFQFVKTWKSVFLLSCTILCTDKQIRW